jgi:hypothetical protein
MLRKFSIAVAAGASAMLGLAGVANADRSTVRIETRPFYGAVVTLEEGVRVFRPLPPDRLVIIDPNRTPVSIGLNEGGGGYEHGSSGSYRSNTDGYSDNGVYSAPDFGYGRRYWRSRGQFQNRFLSHHGRGRPMGGIQAH